jgi:hypothetical protein
MVVRNVESMHGHRRVGQSLVVVATGAVGNVHVYPPGLQLGCDQGQLPFGATRPERRNQVQHLHRARLSVVDGGTQRRSFGLCSCCISSSIGNTW